MAVNRDFKCMTCGFFEAKTEEGEVAPCPKCSSIDPEKIMMVFLKAPGTVSDKTKQSDELVAHLMNEFGLSDYTNNPNRPGGQKFKRADAPETPSEVKIQRQPPVDIPAQLQMMKDGGMFIPDDIGLRVAEKLPPPRPRVILRDNSKITGE